MVKYVNKSIVLFLVFLLLLIIVPSIFASDAVDNQTVVSSDEQIEISAVNAVSYTHLSTYNLFIAYRSVGLLYSYIE